MLLIISFILPYIYQQISYKLLILNFSMTSHFHKNLLKSAYDVLAMALGLRRHHIDKNIYIDKYGAHFIRSKWGFEPTEKYNQKIKIQYLERKIEQLNQLLADKDYEIEHLLLRKEGLDKQIDIMSDQSKSAKKEKGFLKKLLKEVLDKNLALDKRMERMVHHEENLSLQITKLKTSKENLLEHNQHLIEKSQQQKMQLQTLQKVIEQQKKTYLQSH